MTELKWMEFFCNPDHRENLSKPMSMTIDGEPYAVASNGYVLVMVKAQNDFESVSKRMSEESAERIKGYFELGKSGKTTALASIKEWAGPPQMSDQANCEKCSGKGKIACKWCRGKGERLCECDCGHMHDAECYECDGTGKQECNRCQVGRATPVRYGWLEKNVFNRELFARALHRFDDNLIKVHLQEGEFGIAYLQGADWHVTITGLRVDDPKRPDIANAPVWRERDAS